MNKNSVISTATAVILIFLMVSSVFIVFSNPAASTVKAQTTSPTTSVTQTPWPMFGYDAARDRDNKAVTSAPTTGHILWTAKTGGPVESSPAVNYGMVYVGSNDGNVYAFDEQTGALIWKYQTGAVVYSSPAAVNNMVYVGSENGQVYCLNAASGDLVWNFTTGGAVMSSPLVVNGNVYIGSGDTYLYCLDAATGALVWKFGPTEGPIISSPCYTDGNVFFGTAGGSYDANYPGFAQVAWSWLYQLDATTGAQLWKFEISFFLKGSLAVSDQVLTFATDSVRYDNIYGIDWINHQVLWMDKIGAAVESSPAVSAGEVYVGGSDWYLHCIDGLAGTVIWQTKTTGEIGSSPAIADGMAYVGSNDGWFYCFNQTYGDVLWRVQTGGDIVSSPAIADGNVYVGSNDGYLYCFGYGTSTTTTNYPWVMGGQNTEVTFSTQSPGPSTPNLLWVAKVGYVLPLDRTFNYDPNLMSELDQWQEDVTPQTSSFIELAGQGDLQYWYGSAVISNGTVYFVGDGAYAFDALTGKQLWYNSLFGVTVNFSPIMVYDGVVSIPGDDVALNATTGALLYVGAQGWDLYNGNVYGNGPTGGDVQINDTTGAIISIYSPGIPMDFKPAAIVNGVLYGPDLLLPTPNETVDVIGISLATGKTVFTSQSYPAGVALSAQTIVADGEIFQTCYSPIVGVTAISQATGQILWTTNVDDVNMGNAYANGIIYTMTTCGTLWAMNATNGQILWQFSSGAGHDFYSPAVSGDGKIYVGGVDGDMYCLNATTGVVIWNYQTRGPIVSDISIADGVVYAASSDGFLYAFADNQSLAAAGISKLAYGPSVAADAPQSSTTTPTTAMSQAAAAKPVSPASPASASWPITTYVAVTAAVAVAVVATVVATTVVVKRSKRK